jgi:valyl-tRNA synthetase
MRGKSVFYPIGWDDNGLPTERRVQNYFGVRCDPALPYDPGFAPPVSPPAEPVPVSRRTFIELCETLTRLDEQAFEEVWRRAGLSVDWSTCYRTAGADARAISQRAFLRNLARGEAYLAQAPALWDVTFQTAVAQAEVEDREVAGARYILRFHGPGGLPVPVTTTRPELLPACVALVAHPGDSRYASLAGSTVRTPLFGVEVPVLSHRLADPAKGTGIAMVCTFGDMTDVTWWRELNLPSRPVVGQDGRLLACPPPAVTSRAGRAAYAELAGETVTAARARVAALLRGSGDLAGPPEPVRHPVSFYEKGSQPLEIITTRQWYLRDGGRDPALRAALAAAGRKLAWHPPFMQARFTDWVNGLSGDWLVSRQRFFGVPVPVWYPLDEQGRPRYAEPLLPGDADLPVDPSASPPPGYAEGQRGQPGGFAADPDVMDIWATSSLTPLIAARWTLDGDLSDRVLPMDLRPQAHEIIRTWLFYTLLRFHAERGELPWRHAAISGWVLGADRKKMSKSAGNVLTPMGSLRAHGSDAVRYWAAGGRLGTDLSFAPGQLRAGRRLALKILNASRFVLALPWPGPAVVSGAAGAAVVTEPLDAAMLAGLAEVTARCTGALDAFDHTGALAAAERFFWSFCDDYLELVKARAYGERGEQPAGSARLALRLALSVLLRLFAPFLPFATEEAWSWWQDGSVHRAPWPAPGELCPAGLKTPPGGPAALAAAASAIRAIRAAKSAAGLPLRSPARALTVTGCPEDLAVVRAVLPDVTAAGRVGHAELRERNQPRPGYQVSL